MDLKGLQPSKANAVLKISLKYCTSYNPLWKAHSLLQEMADCHSLEGHMQNLKQCTSCNDKQPFIEILIQMSVLIPR